MFLWSSVHDPHLHRVSNVAVMHVGRIIRIQHPRGFPSRNQSSSCVFRIGGHVYYLRRIANSP